jgi:hypothetical protein
MRAKSNVSSHRKRRSAAGKSESVLLSESEQSSLTEKVNTLTKGADDLRIKIKNLETEYGRDRITARQHDKQVKQYLCQLFDVNREILPLKERIQRDAEEKERMKVRQKLEVMGAMREKTKSARKHAAPRKTATRTKSRRKRAAS